MKRLDTRLMKRRLRSEISYKKALRLKSRIRLVKMRDLEVQDCRSRRMCTDSVLMEVVHSSGILRRCISMSGIKMVPWIMGSEGLELFIR